MSTFFIETLPNYIVCASRYIKRDLWSLVAWKAKKPTYIASISWILDLICGIYTFASMSNPEMISLFLGWIFKEDTYGHAWVRFLSYVLFQTLKLQISHVFLVLHSEVIFIVTILISLFSMYLHTYMPWVRGYQANLTRLFWVNWRVLLWQYVWTSDVSGIKYQTI